MIFIQHYTGWLKINLELRRKICETSHKFEKLYKWALTPKLHATQAESYCFYNLY